MKKLVTTIAFLVVSTLAHAGPFGLSMGMQKSQIKGVEGTGTPFMYTTSSVPTPSSQFESYVMQIGDKNGLCVVKATSARFPQTVT